MRSNSSILALTGIAVFVVSGLASERRAEPSGEVTFLIDSRQTKPISPFIYGTNTDDDTENHNGWRNVPLNAAVVRFGGNFWTPYNWENNATNMGHDWIHENAKDLFGAGDIPGEAVRLRVADAHAKNAAAIVTVPICGYVAADKNSDGDIAQTPNYLSTRLRISVAKKNAPFTLSPNLGDASVYQDEFIHFLKVKFPRAWDDPVKRIFFTLDNEPDLWSESHPRIHPSTATYDEIRQKTIAYATAIKDVAPKALVFGPGTSGWDGMVNFQHAPDGNGQDFQGWFLQRMKEAETAAGKRLLDALDFHWYPEWNGSGVLDAPDDNSDAAVAARVQAPRSLWDPTYTETTWITEGFTQGPIRLLARIQEKIDANYPGTKMAIGEYTYAGGGHISGAIAQADALGIFGREGVFAANLHRLGSKNQAFVHAGFKLYRDYNGANGSFGDTSVKAETSDASKSSVYASVDAGKPNRMVIVAINKTPRALRTKIAIAHAVGFEKAEVWRLTGDKPIIALLQALPIGAGNVFAYVMPAMSATTLVLKP